ncbi:MAG: SET domain-containing protein-lysine N-methyltransferase [Cyanobacteria bacterium P01_F01_bin.150]
MQTTEIQVPHFAKIVECKKTGEKALHATTAFMPGELFSTFGAKKIYTEPNYLTVQKSDYEHIMLDPEFLQYINHGCEPNVHFNPIKGTVTVLQKINPGDELTFFYPSTEWSMDQGFDCRCNSTKCLGCIKGAAYISLEILSTYQLSPYIQERLRREKLKSN